MCGEGGGWVGVWMGVRACVHARVYNAKMVTDANTLAVCLTDTTMVIDTHTTISAPALNNWTLQVSHQPAFCLIVWLAAVVVTREGVKDPFEYSRCVY